MIENGPMRPTGLFLLSITLLSAAAAAAAVPPAMAQRRLVLIDQDGSGPGGSNQMSMMVLLQSPDAEVLGITVVTGNAWRDEEVQHTLRMLELMKRTDVPVVPGAVFPLGRIHVEQYAYLATRLDSMKEGNST